MASVARSLFNQSVRDYFDPIPDENFDLSWSDGLVVRGLTLRSRSVNQELARNGVDLRVSNGRVGELRLGYSPCSGNVSMQLRDVDFSVKPNPCRLVGKCVASSLYKCVTKPIACLEAMRARRLLAPPVPIYYYPDENNDYLVELPRSDPMHGGLGQFCCLGISSKKPRVPWKRRLPLKASTAATAIQLEPPGPYRQQAYWSKRPVSDCDDCAREVQSHFRYYHPGVLTPSFPHAKAESCPDLQQKLLPHHEAYIASSTSSSPERFLLQPYMNEEFSHKHGPPSAGTNGRPSNGNEHNWRPSTLPPHFSRSPAIGDPRASVQPTKGVRSTEVRRIKPQYRQARRVCSSQGVPASQHVKHFGYPSALDVAGIYNRGLAPTEEIPMQQYTQIDSTTGIKPVTDDMMTPEGSIQYTPYIYGNGTATAAPYSFSCQSRLGQQDFHNHSRLTVV